MADNFRTEIENRLTGLPRESISFFAWICAVRALPFLGVKGSFYYWHDETKTQTHLLAVLNALDFNKTYTDAKATADAAYAYADAADADAAAVAVVVILNLLSVYLT